MIKKPLNHQGTYWKVVWNQFRSHRLGMCALGVVLFFGFVGIYAPLLASSKPLMVWYEGHFYFPLFTHLFYRGFFTKRLDIFYNVLMLTLPLLVLSLRFPRKIKVIALLAVVLGHAGAFLMFAYGPSKNPASDVILNRQRHMAIQHRLIETGEDPLVASLPENIDWAFELRYMTNYAKLNEILRYQLRREQHKRLKKYQTAYSDKAKKRWLAQAIVKKRAELIAAGTPFDEVPSTEELGRIVQEEISQQEMALVTAMPTLWQVELANENREIARQQAIMEDLEDQYPAAKEELELLIEACKRLSAKLFQLRIELASSGDPRCEALEKAAAKERARLAEKRQIVEQYESARDKVRYLQDRREWLEQQAAGLRYRVMPLVRHFHWEDDAGGEQSLNQYIGWLERTRVNRKDLVAALIFGIRVSLVVGLLAVSLALVIGIPIGGGKFDIIVSRLLEIWESMPTFFMLLLVVAVTQSKSIFLVISVIGLFGWTAFSRFVRGEVFKQRNLAYVEACHCLGFADPRIIFVHILPNAIPPLLTLLPFSVMAAITSEAGLSFLGLGEEGSCSCGVLMDEGRTAFPGESYLLWPPAILLTALLIAIALVGDALRDSIDPRLRRR